MITATFHITYPRDRLFMRLASAFSPRAIRVSLPECWEEVPARKVPRICEILANPSHERSYKLLAILKELLPLPRWLFFHLTPQDVVEALEPRVVWFLDEPIATPVVPSVRVGWRRWRIPAPAARDMTIGQFLQVEQAWSRMAKGQNDPVFLLAAILRPHRATKDAQGLLPYVSSFVIEGYAKALRLISLGDAYYILQYWAAQKKALEKQFPDFFSGGESSGAPLDWESIPARIAEAGVFGTVEQVLQTPARTYLAWSNARMQEQGEEQQTSLQDMIRANHNKFLS